MQVIRGSSHRGRRRSFFSCLLLLLFLLWRLPLGFAPRKLFLLNIETLAEDAPATQTAHSTSVPSASILKCPQAKTMQCLDAEMYVAAQSLQMLLASEALMQWSHRVTHRMAHRMAHRMTMATMMWMHHPPKEATPLSLLPTHKSLTVDEDGCCAWFLHRDKLFSSMTGSGLASPYFTSPHLEGITFMLLLASEMPQRRGFRHRGDYKVTLKGRLTPTGSGDARQPSCSQAKKASDKPPTRLLALLDISINSDWAETMAHDFSQAETSSKANRHCKEKAKQQSNKAAAQSTVQEACARCSKDGRASLREGLGRCAGASVVATGQAWDLKTLARDHELITIRIKASAAREPGNEQVEVPKPTSALTNQPNPGSRPAPPMLRGRP